MKNEFKDWLFSTTSTKKFRKMPVGAQALFFHLAANANDDGETVGVTFQFENDIGFKISGATFDYVDVLEKNGYIYISYDGLNFHTRVIPEKKHIVHRHKNAPASADKCRSASADKCRL